MKGRWQEYGYRNYWSRCIGYGCSHCGIVNILQAAEPYAPTVCIGGFHLCWPSTGESVAPEFLDAVVGYMAGRDMEYYTCHCTGISSYNYLKTKLERLSYFSGGMSLTV